MNLEDVKSFQCSHCGKEIPADEDVMIVDDRDPVTRTQIKKGLVHRRCLEEFVKS
jgi:hypothetical protein